MFESLYIFWIKMGVIALPLFIMGIWGWYYVVELGMIIFREKKSHSWTLEQFENSLLGQEATFRSPASILDTYLKMIIRYRREPTSHIRTEAGHYLDENLGNFRQKLQSIKIFAAAAPLLGLLGTVNGMIVTFDIISNYGNSSPVLISDGISEALLTTQSGLVVALPLLFFHVVLRGMANRLEREAYRFFSHYEYLKSENRI